MSKGDHILLECSNCQAPLLDVIMTHENPNIVTEVIAKCCYCGDKSFMQTIVGNFSPGGTDYACINDSDLEGSRIIFDTICGEKLWKTT